MSDTDTKVLYEEPEYYETENRRWKLKYWISGALMFLIELALLLFVSGAFSIAMLLIALAWIFLPVGLHRDSRGMAWVGLIALALTVLVSIWGINHPPTPVSRSATPGNYGSSQSQATAAVSTGTMTSSASAEPTTVVASETPSPSATPEPTTAVTASAKSKPSATKAAVKTTEPSADSFPQQQVAPDPTSDPQPSVTPTFNGNGGRINQGQIPQPG